MEGNIGGETCPMELICVKKKLEIITVKLGWYFLKNFINLMYYSCTQLDWKLRIWRIFLELSLFYTWLDFSPIYKYASKNIFKLFGLDSHNTSWPTISEKNI